MWCSTRIYLRVTPSPNVYKWFATGIKQNWVIPLWYLYLLSRKFFSQMKSPPQRHISYRNDSLKQHNIVEYLGCYFDSNFNIESVARRVLKKINLKQNFLWRQSNNLNYSSRRLLCNKTTIWLWMHIMVCSPE